MRTGSNPSPDFPVEGTHAPGEALEDSTAATVFAGRDLRMTTQPVGQALSLSTNRLPFDAWDCQTLGSF